MKCKVFPRYTALILALFFGWLPREAFANLSQDSDGSLRANDLKHLANNLISQDKGKTLVLHRITAPASTIIAQNSSGNDFGAVEGGLFYPSDYVPAMTVCAQSTSNYYLLSCVQTEEEQRVYELNVRPGEYFIFSYTDDEGLPVNHYYATQGEGARPISVNVTAGKKISNIDLSVYWLCGQWADVPPSFCVQPPN